MSKSNLYHVKLTFTEPQLGTAPSDPEMYSKYIATKKFKETKKHPKTTPAELEAIDAEEKALVTEELATLPPDEGRGLTVFRRDNGGLMLPDYMIRGFLKEAASAMGIDKDTYGLHSKIDKWVFITNQNRTPIRWLPLMRDGVQLTKPDGQFERTLRAQTMQGPRVTFACSEIVNPPADLDFCIYVLPLGAEGKKGKYAITEEVLRSWLSYGAFCGLGCFRTGSYGRFMHEMEAL